MRSASGSAAIFARDAATGTLTETSCAVADDSRCTQPAGLQGVSGAAVSPDGREVYVVACQKQRDQGVRRSAPP